MPSKKSLAEIYDQEIRPLAAEDRLQLVATIARELALEARESSKTRSLLELEGVGAEIWRGIDAQSYVDDQRREWDVQS